MTTETVTICHELSQKGKLKDFYPIPERDYEKLKEMSERRFSLDEMNSILLKLSEKMKDKPKEPSFESRRQFMNYISKCLRMEKGQEGEIKEYKLSEEKGQPIKQELIKGNQETAGELTLLVKATLLKTETNQRHYCEISDTLEVVDISESERIVKIDMSDAMRSNWSHYKFRNYYKDYIHWQAFWDLQEICEQNNFTVELTYPDDRTTIITPETKKKEETFRQKCIDRHNEAEKQRQGIKHKTIDASLEFKPISMDINKLLGLRSTN